MENLASGLRSWLARRGGMLGFFRGLACGFCTMTMFSWHVPSVLCVDVQESMVSFRAQDS